MIEPVILAETLRKLGEYTYTEVMVRKITIELPPESIQTIESLGRAQNRSAEVVAQDILERALTVARIRSLREVLSVDAAAAGFDSEKAVLDAIS